MNENLNVWLDSMYFMLDRIHRNWLQTEAFTTPQSAFIQSIYSH